MSKNPNSKAFAKRLDSPLELYPSPHFFVATATRKLGYGAICGLTLLLSKAKVGERRSVMSNGFIIVAEKTSAKTGVIVTGWAASDEQLEVYYDKGEIDAIDDSGSVRDENDWPQSRTQRDPSTH